MESAIIWCVAAVFILCGEKRKRARTRITGNKTRLYLRDFFMSRPHFDQRLSAADSIAVISLSLGFLFLLGGESVPAMLDFVIGITLFYFSHFQSVLVVEPKAEHTNKSIDLEGENWRNRVRVERQTSGLFSPVGDMVKLYRALARRYHPDYALTIEERMKCEIVMKEINRAYQDFDEAALRIIAARDEYLRS